MLLTESSSADLFLRDGKYQNQLDHDFRDNIRHKRVQRDLGIDMETFEEVSEAFEEFEEGVVARAHSISASISGLRSFESNIRSIRPTKKEGTHGE